MTITHQQQKTSIAIDIGGTFTDVVTFDSQTGRFWNSKVSSTPQDQSIGFDHGVEQGLLGMKGLLLSVIVKFLNQT